MTAISCQDLSKSYGHYQVLQGINLTIQEGECFSLFGPNGAGKTTLLKILATLHRPSEGSYEILGLDGLKNKEEIRANIMFLGHGAHLYDDLDAKENLKFALALRGQTTTDHEMKQALDRVGIGAFAEMKVRNYSAGMKKRLALAKTMLAKPKVLLLDEPFTALDTAGTEIMREYIRERLSEQGAVMMSTHDHDKARPITTRAGMLRQGALKEISIEALNSDDLF